MSFIERTLESQIKIVKLGVSLIEGVFARQRGYVGLQGDELSVGKGNYELAGRYRFFVVNLIKIKTLALLELKQVADFGIYLAKSKQLE